MPACFFWWGIWSGHGEFGRRLNGILDSKRNLGSLVVTRISDCHEERKNSKEWEDR